MEGSNSNQLNKEVTTFDKLNLKKTTTIEKKYNPTKADIEEEKKAEAEKK